MIWLNDNKKSVPANNGEANILLSVTCIFWLAAKIISWKLWGAERLFPIIPAFDFFATVPAMAHWVLLFLSIALLIALTIRPGYKPLQYLLFFVEVCACVLDENRWQPWEYLYLFILLLFILNKSGKTAVIHSGFVIVLATIYFYSGIHKMQESFVTYMWDHTILKRLLHLPIAFYKKNWLHYCGYALPLIECIGGIGLLFARTKKVAAILLIAMHGFILVLLGPLGTGYNVIVWPWNIAMIFYLYRLFIKNESASSFQFGCSPGGSSNKWSVRTPTTAEHRLVKMLTTIERWSVKISTTAEPRSVSSATEIRNANSGSTLRFHLPGNRFKIVLFCWAFLPALNFIGWWDHYLSWNLYSHTLPTMTICIRDILPDARLQPYLNKKVNPLICEGDALLNIQTWAMKEMNVPPCPELRNYKKIKAHWIKNYPLPKVDFIIDDFTFFGRRIEVK